MPFNRLIVPGAVNLCGTSRTPGIDAPPSPAGLRAGRCSAVIVKRALGCLGEVSLVMDSCPPTGPGLGQRLEEAVELIEMELRHAISYLNNAVVPQVRASDFRDSHPVGKAPRVLADIDLNIHARR